MNNNEEFKDTTLVEHLKDLRRVIIISIFSILVSLVLCFSFNETILKFITKPVKNVQFIFVGPAEVFITSIYISLFCGVLLALPIILKEIIWFISPGLTSLEKKVIIPMLIIGYFLFILGVVFAYYILLPVGINFLIGFAPPDITPMISIGRYTYFSIMLILCTGLVFELPIVLILLSKLNIINSNTLLKQWRYAILISFIISALVTPSVDVFTQSILAFTLIFMYYISIIFVKIFEKKQ